MATLLSQYQQQQSALLQQLSEGKLKQSDLLAFQELNYRISVLQTMQFYCKTAPVTKDVRQMGYHYQLVDAALRFLLTERKFGPKTDPPGMKRRETAAKSLEAVYTDQARRFQSFAASSPEQYKKSVQEMINTVLPVWVSYRTTFFDIEEAMRHEQ